MPATHPVNLDTELSRVPRLGTIERESSEDKRLTELWESAPGWRGWLSTVDHKSIGLRYVVTAFLFLIAGGIEALIMRVQLARPGQTLLTPEQYSQLFTMHGVTMIFLYALPILSGFSNYLWPLLIGSRDMAFPRLNAVSYWLYLFAGIFLYSSFPLGEAPNAGWFNYVPFAGAQFDPGPNIDVYALGMVLLGLSTTVGAINFIVTLFRMRAPGMGINRMPILVWGTLTASVANLLAVPSVSLAFFLLWMDRNVGSHFFDVVHGGKPLLWQHLFWMFAHPWVYAIVLPAMGIVSDALPTFCRRPLVGYTAVAVATMATMLFGFGVWIHHMFATGLPALALSFFSAASMVISIPSAVAVFAWIATIWLGRPVFRTPFLFFAGFVLLFVMGGVSGVMTAAVPLDLQLNETYFVVAHLHYVLLGINVFPVMGGIYYWFPKVTGRMTSERLGKWSFWVLFVGFNVAFFPMHVAGLLGMPRRIYTYSSSMGWDGVNMVTSVGSFLFAFGVLLFLINVLVSCKRGQVASDNPWDASSLEWSIPSPPPPYNFAVLPIVESRHPLWESRLGETDRRSSLARGYTLLDGRETLGTSPLDATPRVILRMPGDDYSPFALGVTASLIFVCLLLHWWVGVGLAALASAAALTVWMWPRLALGQRVAGSARQALDTAARALRQAGGQPDQPALALPVGSAGKRATGSWGVVALIVTEASLFTYLLLSYFYLAIQSQTAFPPNGLPKLALPAVNTLILLSSSVALWIGERAIRKDKRPRALIFQGLAIVLGTVFVAIQLKEWHDKPFGLVTHQYGSLYFTITGFHMMHVVVGLIVLGWLFVWTALGYFDRRRHAALAIGGLYWHFVDAVWLFVFCSLYLTPYLR